jgi:hypothetical protein
MPQHLATDPLVGQLPSAAALGSSLVVAHRTDTARNGVGGRGT